MFRMPEAFNDFLLQSLLRKVTFDPMSNTTCKTSEKNMEGMRGYLER